MRWIAWFCITAWMLALPGCDDGDPATDGGQRSSRGPAAARTATATVAPARWYTVGRGRFSWGERWRLRVRRADIDGRHCVNLVPQQRLARRCSAGWPSPSARVATVGEFEDPCSAYAYAYGGLPRETATLKFFGRRGAVLPARVRFLEPPKGLGIDARYFVAEVQARKRPARSAASIRMGWVAALDAGGRELDRSELSPNDVVTTFLC